MVRPGWLVLAVVAMALGETTAHYIFKNRAPSEQQWQQLRTRLGQPHQNGDLVAVAPAWAEPLARMTLGDALMPLSMVARADDEDFARAIEIDFMGQSRSELGAWPELRRVSVGPFTLLMRKNPRYVPARYQFIDHVEDTSMTLSVQQNGVAQVCPFTRSAPQSSGGLGGEPTSPRVRYDCPGGAFHWVGVTIIDDEKYRPRRCIWAAPNSAGAVKFTFRQVPLGRRLLGHAGTPWLMARDGVGSQVTIAGATTGGPLGTTRVTDTAGWTRFEWNTQALKNATEDVQLTIVGTPGKDQRFCFTLEAQ